MATKGYVNKAIITAAASMIMAACMICAGTGAVFAEGDGAVQWTQYTLPKAVDNTSVSVQSTSSLTALPDGYMRVCFDGKNVVIEYYDESFKMTKRGFLPLELDYWGGFYSGSDAYYLAEAKTNEAENDNAEVIRVIKYDKNWNRIGAASIAGWQVRYPFHAGSVNFTEYQGKLYLATGHEGYVDPSIGQGHQGLLVIEIDEASMTGDIIMQNLRHSFAQFVEQSDGYIYLLEQCEGDRYTSLKRWAPEIEGSLEAPISVLDYGGVRESVWAIPCYASVDGLTVSDDNILGIGSSIDQTKYNSVTENTPHNIYLTITPKSDFTEGATRVKWLTNYRGNGTCFAGLHITKINNDRFLVTWEEYTEDEPVFADVKDTLSYGTLQYLFIDGSGNVVSDKMTARALISDCAPVVSGNKAVWYTSNANMLNFYSIDTESGEFSKKQYRIAGDNVTWNYSGGTLTLNGSGAITVDQESACRGPISTTAPTFTDFEEMPWRSIHSKVKSLVIGSGITSISERAFPDFGNMISVSLPKGLKSIGKEAFYGCRNLEVLSIPASVTKIGKDILWTGFYWSVDEKSVWATIKADCNTEAIRYAKKNGIEFIAKHKYGNYKVTLKPTVLKTGKKTRTCSVCKGTNTASIPKLKATIKVSKTKVTLKKKQSVKIKVTYGRGDSVKSWKSSKKKVASVSKKGVIKAKKKGSATITVTLKSGKKAKIKVKVK